MTDRGQMCGGHPPAVMILVLAIVGIVVVSAVDPSKSLSVTWSLSDVLDALGWVVALFLLAPLYITVVSWIYVGLFGVVFGDLDDMRLGADNFIESIIWGYVHLVARIVLFPLGRIDLADRLYRYGGAYCYRNDSGHVVVSSVSPEEREERGQKCDPDG